MTIKKYYTLLRSYFPSSLPTGLTEFYAWSDRIISIVGPMADQDSMRFALASQIIHLPPQVAHRADQFFVRSLRKAGANQVASQVFQDIKLKQQEEAKKAAEQKQEDTNLKVVSLDDSQKATH